MKAVLGIGAAALLSLASPFRFAVDAQSRASTIQLVRETVIDGELEDLSVVNGGHSNSRYDIAITMRQDFQVRVYDVHGKRIASIGRRGQAPGEFLQPQAQGWLADTVWIYDATLRRHSYYTRSGKLLRTAPLETSARLTRIVGDSAGSRLIGFFPWVRRVDGWLVGSATIARSTRTGSQRESVLGSYSPDGKFLKVTSIDQDSRWEAALAITRVAAVSPSGLMAVVASVTDLSESGSEIVISRYDDGGALRGTARVPYQGVRYPADVRDRMLRRGLGPDHDRTVIASRIPSVLAPLHNILLRDDGVVLLTIAKTTEIQSLVLLHPQGGVLGTVVLPRRADVIATRGPYVWMRERDSDDVPSVVRYRLLCGSKVCMN